MKITDGGLVPYLKKLCGQDPKMTEEFVNGWHKGTLMTFVAKFKIDEAFIVEITGLQMVGKKFYKERKAMEESLSVFFDKQSERDRVRTMADGGYNRERIAIALGRHG